MRARSLLAVAAVLLLVLAPAMESFAAKRGGGSFSSGGSRSGSSGWSSSTRPSQPSAPPSSGSSSGWSGATRQSQPATPSPSAQGALPQGQQSGAPGWSSSTGQSATQAQRPAGTSAFSSSGADAAKRQAATTSYQGYQGLYSKPGNPVNPGQVSTGKPILNQNRTFGSYQDYSRYRDNYYAGRGWSAPGYAYRSFSGFGMWDAMFMWFMLSNLTSGAGFFHNHQADPGVQAFKQEAAKLSESDAELKKQLDDLNAKLDQMKKDGVPVDPAAMPKDVDPDIALAQPRIEDKGDSSSSSMFWPVVSLVLLGGGAYLVFNRRRHA